MEKSAFFPRVVLCFVVVLSACSAWRVEGKNWSYDFKKPLDSDETRKETISPGESVSIQNSGSITLAYNPTGDTQVLRASSGDSCRDEPIELATLFPAATPAPTWMQTGSTRTLAFPTNAVPAKQTTPFCFKVTDTQKNKTLTAIIKVAGAQGLSAALGVSIGIPALAFALSSI
ncbi:SRS domain-containing protein [Neospora caninum Liverpool]|uniref:SRS domain-containing protein n=2 Tax=Neospora caninum TaxID=29176 RepID=F0VEM5_NEOCL|nr:SRS domain-containing protein [Neospora caninum Liverpool]AAW88532.1 bradyzoite protein SAG4 [Neospora caninum]CBZ52169.1 SRS domain-containing protein [Neospora caninum Liverpool]CEL66135.1 TPA: SRS domain-containing protein [Neospora caninum Liverpool]|eukprot:XP_003882201.1 SRS domain-containing protein [Neospora caninum Liverpool]